jgi:hypothetical protein
MLLLLLLLQRRRRRRSSRRRRRTAAGPPVPAKAHLSLYMASSTPYLATMSMIMVGG